MLGAGHTSLSLLRFCSSGCIDMRAAHTVNRPTDWVLVGFHRSAGLGAPCSATSLVFSPAFIATRAESERGASRAGHAGKLRPILAGRQKNALAARLSRRFLSWLWWRRPPQGHLPPSRADRSVVFLLPRFLPALTVGNLAGCAACDARPRGRRSPGPPVPASDRDAGGYNAAIKYSITKSVSDSDADRPTPDPGPPRFRESVT